MEGGVVVGGLNPVNVGGGDEEDFARALDGDAAGGRGGLGAGGGDFVFGAGEGAVEAGVVVGLEQVIQRPGLEGADGILVICGYKYDGGRSVVAEELENIESVRLRHLHIEEEEVGAGRADGGGGLDAGAAFAGEFDAGIEAEEAGDVAAGERLIIHNHDANGSGSERANLSHGRSEREKRRR